MLSRAITLFAIFALTATAIARGARSDVVAHRLPFATFPMQLDDWSGRQEPAFDDKTLAILGLDDYVSRAYVSRQSAAGLYVGYWASQRAGDTIHSPLNCLPGAGWEPLSKSALDIEVREAVPIGSPTRTIAVNRYVIQNGLDRQMVLYWYQSHGRVVASEYFSKFFLVADAIRLNRTDAALVRVILRVTDDGGGETGAEREGVRFVKSLFPMLAAFVPA
jgi:EpsI family protein